MVQFLAELHDSGGVLARTILDLGCGNGSLLRAVREELFSEGGTPRLLGVDYSEASISLAQSVNNDHVEEEGHGDDDDEDDDDEDDDDDKSSEVPITFRVWDMLQGSVDDLDEPDGWDLVLDKGTFDAISLGNNALHETEGAQAGPSVEVQYRTRVLQLLRPGGRFLITSCNWTESELCAWMEDEEERTRGAWLVQTGRVAYPSFQFGGVQGQTVCTVCFEKRVAA